MLCALTLTACQRPAMVLPTMFEAGTVAPLVDTPADWQGNKYEIFYATDRKFDPSARPMGLYSHLRNDTLSLGKLTIALGQDDAWQAFSAATQAIPDGQRPRPKLASIHRLGVMQWGPAGRHDQASDHKAEQAFIKRLDAAVQQSTGKAINIYIHGFKNSFEEAALTASELSLYSGGLGPYILYSWPSLDSLFEYSHDRDSVRYTTAHARRFFEMLNHEIDEGRLSAERINVITHSSGGEVIGTVLRELGLMSHNETPEQRKAKWRIGTVLMIAPDISTDVARERILKEDLRGMFEQIVVYTSKKDSALRYASKFLYRTNRIGSIYEEGLTVADRRWLAQATNVTLINIDARPSGDPVGHSHHRFSGATISDILLCLRSDLPPQQRGLIRSEEAVIWQFAEDYEKRVTEAAEKVYGTAQRQHPASDR